MSRKPDQEYPKQHEQRFFSLLEELGFDPTQRGAESRFREKYALGTESVRRWKSRGFGKALTPILEDLLQGKKS